MLASWRVLWRRRSESRLRGVLWQLAVRGGGVGALTAGLARLLLGGRGDSMLPPLWISTSQAALGLLPMYGLARGP